MKKMMIAASVILAAAPALAVDAPKGMIDYAQSQMQRIIENPDVIAAIHAQNSETKKISEAAILEMDQMWRAEILSNNRPMISEKMDSPVSDALAMIAEESGGRLTEVFIMDARGLNVGQSDLTSDYWQGDEAKFQQTYPIGPNAMHVSEIELDESTQTYQGQVLISITDPSSGAAIGAVTFGIDALSFF